MAGLALDALPAIGSHHSSETGRELHACRVAWGGGSDNGGQCYSHLQDIIPVNHYPHILGTCIYIIMSMMMLP